MIRLERRSGFVSVARLIARGFFGGFGMLRPHPQMFREWAVFHISAKSDNRNAWAWRLAQQ
jgi:hypothetical protein